MIIMSRNRLIQNAHYALVFILCISCSEKKPVNSNENAAEVLPEDIVEMRYDQVKMANIDTGSVEFRSLAGTLKTSGKVSVAPGSFATVCAPLGGFVKNTNLLPGDRVSRGQSLALIENQEFVDIQENFLEARSRLEFAEAEFKRHSELYKEDVYSEKNLQQVTADYKSLKAHVTALEQKLALIGIDPSNLQEDNIKSSVMLVSPISGYIKNVNVNIGKSISPTDILFEIVNTDNLFLELSLFEKDAGKISAGQQISFFINNETEEHSAVITQTGQSVDADKAYKVYAKVTKGCKNILPGMYVNAIIEISGNSVPSLPSDAVVSFDDKDYIFLFDRNKEENGNAFTEYRIVEVHKGMTDGGHTEIILPDNFDIKNAKVVIRGAYNLLSAKKNAGEMAC
jgi:cobalt-zinc-cadmium efflux system membrane fusion protein